MKTGFHEFYEKNIDRDLLKRMKVLDRDGKFEPNQWEIAGLYQVFAFEKIVETSEEIDDNGPDGDIQNDTAETKDAE